MLIYYSMIFQYIARNYRLNLNQFYSTLWQQIEKNNHFFIFVFIFVNNFKFAHTFVCSTAHILVIHKILYKYT
jgi:hypothetical protein